MMSATTSMTAKVMTNCASATAKVRYGGTKKKSKASTPSDGGQDPRAQAEAGGDERDGQQEDDGLVGLGQADVLEGPGHQTRRRRTPTSAQT